MKDVNSGTGFALDAPSAIAGITPLGRWKSDADGLNHRSNLAGTILLFAVFCDALVVAIALEQAFWIRFCGPLANFGIRGQVTFHDYTRYVLLGVSWMLCALVAVQVYDRRTLLHFRLSAERLLRGGMVWFLGFLGFSLMCAYHYQISRVYLIVSAVTVNLALISWRFVFHRCLQRTRLASKLRQRVLFIGWSSEAEKLTQSFDKDSVHPYEAVGYIPLPGTKLEDQPPVAWLGGYDRLREIIYNEEIDAVMLADVDCLKSEIVAIANLCEREMVQFNILPSYFQILVSGLKLQTMSGVPVLGVSELALDKPVGQLAKRIVDIIGASIGLIFSIPVIIIFGLLVYIESPGPIFYWQTRMGRNGHLFKIIKIRSMRLDAEANSKVGWTVKDDPRRLRVGGFMRRWNIDEVPQFWNVLKGQMSLVGPRPERPELIVNFKDEIPHYNARHNAKPGITGWAQIKGLRGDTDLRERIDADIYYLENWSLLLDFHIMLHTLVKTENAC